MCACKVEWKQEEEEEEVDGRRHRDGFGLCLPNPAKETGQIRRLFAHRFVHVRPLPPPSLCEPKPLLYRAPSPEADPENGRVPSTFRATDSSLLLVVSLSLYETTRRSEISTSRARFYLYQPIDPRRHGGNGF